jgi:hypothetical protein
MPRPTRSTAPAPVRSAWAGAVFLSAGVGFAALCAAAMVPPREVELVDLGLRAGGSAFVGAAVTGLFGLAIERGRFVRGFCRLVKELVHGFRC